MLDSSKLSAVDHKFVLTGADYKTVLEDKSLFEQMKESLKKFKGQSVVANEYHEKGVKVWLRGGNRHLGKDQILLFLHYTKER